MDIINHPHQMVELDILIVDCLAVVLVGQHMLHHLLEVATVVPES